MLWIVIIVLVLALALARACALSTKKKGKRGEKHIQKLLSKLPENEYTTFNDVVLKTAHGTTQIGYGVPPDETRKPEWYDGIYNYLKNIGIKEI